MGGIAILRQPLESKQNSNKGKGKSKVLKKHPNKKAKVSITDTEDSDSPQPKIHANGGAISEGSDEEIDHTQIESASQSSRSCIQTEPGCDKPDHVETQSKAT